MFCMKAENGDPTGLQRATGEKPNGFPSVLSQIRKRSIASTVTMPVMGLNVPSGQNSAQKAVDRHQNQTYRKSN